MPQRIFSCSTKVWIFKQAPGVLGRAALDARRRRSQNRPQMKTTSHIAKALLLGSLFFSQLPLRAAGADEAKWVSLFNGKDLTGWVPVHGVVAEVNEGNLRIVKGMGWLRSEKEYTDFVLEADWKALVKEYDSGLFLRCIKDGKPWPTDGWQVNLRYNSLGSLVRGYTVVVPSETPKLPVNEWVKFRLEVRGKKCTLFVNGEKAWEFEKLDRDRGYIGIQIEDKAFDFRNIRIQELSSSPAPAAK
jgi:hypothetical protein